MRRLMVFIGCVVMLATASRSQAGIMLTGDVADGTGVLTISSDLEFVITEARTKHFTMNPAG